MTLLKPQNDMGASFLIAIDIASRLGEIGFGRVELLGKWAIRNIIDISLPAGGFGELEGRRKDVDHVW